MGVDALHVIIGRNLKKHGLSNIQGRFKSLQNKIKSIIFLSLYSLTKKLLKPKLNSVFPSTLQHTHSKINNGQTDLNEILHKNLCLDENGTFEPEAKVKPPSYKPLKGRFIMEMPTDP